MKHIFTVHSPITFFCAECVVVYEKLQKEAVIFYYTDYKPVSNLGLVVPSFQEKHKSVWKNLQNFNLVKATDRYLSKISEGNDITAYIDLAHYHQKILITHKNCRAFHFIEEGMASYMAPDNLPELTRIEKGNFRNKKTTELFRNLFRLARGFNLKTLALPYFANAFMHFEKMKFYTFSDQCYPGVPDHKKVILNPKNMAFNHSHTEEELSISGNIILIEESFFRVYKTSAKETEQVHRESLSMIAKKYPGRGIVVKLRPKQSKDNSHWIKQLDDEGITYKVLDSKEPLEEQLVMSQNCILLGTVSSLLYYGAIFGHESHSNFLELEDLPKSFSEAADYYWEKVKPLEE